MSRPWPGGGLVHSNLAARAGRWSAQHRRKAILGWLAFVIVAAFVGFSIGTKTLESDQYGIGESGKADKAYSDNFPDRAYEQVLVQSGQKPVTDPKFKAAVADVVTRLQRVRGLQELKSPLAPGNSDQVSKDRHSALVTFYIPGNDTKSQDRVDAPLAAVAAADRANPGFRVEEFGGASANKAINKAFEKDFTKAEVTSVPITLVILLLAFGAFVAAGVPLLLAVTAVLAAIGLLGPISHVWAVDQSITSVVLLIGLAVGVDYSLFYLRREREERASGKSEEASLQAAAATSGRAVMVSGLTVIIAMAGMYIAGAPTFISFATGCILVVAIALTGSLTVLPAILSWLGDRVNKGRIPFLAPERRTGESRFWGAVLDRVLRRPALSMLLAGGVLVVLAIPTLHIHTAVSGVADTPRSIGVMKTYDRIQKAFPGGPLPAQVVLEADNVRSPQVAGAIAKLRLEAFRHEDLLKRPVNVTISPNNRVASVEIPTAGDGTNGPSNRALALLRDDLVPNTVGGLSGVQANVTGITASSKDFNDLMKSRIVFVFAFVLGLAFLLLLMTFRSIVIPIKAILLNLLSVTAAYGIITWIFQDGHFEKTLGFNSNGAVTAWLPLFLFVILFGLSMDYHVFILTRVRENFDKGMNTEDAVAHGVKGTASVVTAAAAVMVAVFAIFATLTSIEFKEFGVGLAAAVLIDATIVRAVLLPATMKLLGDWNWYLPKWLDWVPDVDPEEHRRPQQPPAGPPLPT
jgi:uncharacterized membrane protein YdfJ with MMPL/SSD domain